MTVQARVAVEIKGEQRPVGHIFSPAFTFSIPPYQRPYAWEKEHAEALLDDLLGALGEDDRADVRAINPYFLGSIVLIAGERGHAEVVDGQQRLITLTILLSALRASVQAEYAQDITPMLYDPEKKLLNQPARFRLRPRQQDVAFFEQHIQREGGIEGLRSVTTAGLSDSQRNLRDNAVLYLDRLAALHPQERVQLAQFIVQRTLLIVVSTQDLDSAYRIFSVLNDRGLDLSYADILKAQIIGNVAPAEQQTFTAKWEGAEDDLGREEFEEMLGYIRMVIRKQKARDTILKEFREYVMTEVPDARRLVDDVVLPYADAYGTLLDQDYRHTRGAELVNNRLRWLNRIPDTDWVPPAMLYLARYRSEPEQLAKFLTDLERLAATLMIRRASLNRRIERYAKVLDAIERGEDLYTGQSPLQLTADERGEVVQALDGDLYLHNARTRQYVLLRLDSDLSGGGAVYDYPIISIEHVLPQNPRGDSMWVRWFPSQQLREQWVHRLGNLVLLSRRKNTAASNYDFDKKKSVYFATKDGIAPFVLTTQVIKEHKWTPDVVERRQQELIARLKRTWRL
ncbi:MAG TPA: DUF262 domain-containing HNH endonuclease family protein [Ktedonobacterales bacterium]|nr:DUF262 domain-containing HNH endonuclease family protein [Ktedonobacterales bacterium]